MSGESAGTFIATKEHRRFKKFAEAVRKHRYVGLCYGAAGVGKTLSTRRWSGPAPSFTRRPFLARCAT